MSYHQRWTSSKISLLAPKYLLNHTTATTLNGLNYYRTQMRTIYHYIYQISNPIRREYLFRQIDLSLHQDLNHTHSTHSPLWLLYFHFNSYLNGFLSSFYTIRIICQILVDESSHFRYQHTFKFTEIILVVFAIGIYITGRPLNTDYHIQQWCRAHVEFDETSVISVWIRDVGRLVSSSNPKWRNAHKRKQEERRNTCNIKREPKKAKKTIEMPMPDKCARVILTLTYMNKMTK